MNEENDFTMTLEDGTVFSDKIRFASSYNKKKKKWFYLSSYVLDAKKDALRKSRILEYTMGEFKFTNPNPQLVKDYFDCMVDLNYKR